MPKVKENELIYNIVMHHISHYQQVKKIFKVDYDSHMIIVVTYSHFLYQTINSSLKKNYKDGLDWNEIFPTIKDLSSKVKKYNQKLSLFAVSHALDIPKESVRRKVISLCKKKYLNYSIKDGLSIGVNFEETVKKLAPKDIAALKKVINVVNDMGGVEKLSKFK